MRQGTKLLINKNLNDCLDAFSSFGINLIENSWKLKLISNPIPMLYFIYSYALGTFEALGDILRFEHLCIGFFLLYSGNLGFRVVGDFLWEAIVEVEEKQTKKTYTKRKDAQQSPAVCWTELMLGLMSGF